MMVASFHVYVFAGTSDLVRALHLVTLFLFVPNTTPAPLSVHIFVRLLSFSFCVSPSPRMRRKHGKIRMHCRQPAWPT
uniref:Putative secreted peptide n=1 Tax=Anopheles braziliensis TaxID=58242 RepID=A0A2M3ZQW9_9DIPT